mgnify:FL=1
MSEGMRELRGSVSKPPLGVPPAYIVIDRRIAELAEAIGRYVEEDTPDKYDKYKMIANMAAEIVGHCEIMRKGRKEAQRWET